MMDLNSHMRYAYNTLQYQLFKLNNRISPFELQTINHSDLNLTMVD